MLHPVLGTEQLGWVCILGAAPFAACGFFTYHGMTAEQVLWAWFKSEVLYPRRLVFRSENLYWQVLHRPHRAENKKAKKQRKGKDIDRK